MKSICWLGLAALFLSACQKELTDPNAPNNPNPSGKGKLTSLRGYVNTILYRVDTFMYHSNGNLLTQKQWTYEFNPTHPDTIQINFNYAGSNPDPTSYTIIDGWGTNTYTLTYDAQGRIVKDTIIPDLAAKACTFTYLNGSIVQNSWNNGSSDTFFISNNNIDRIVQSSLPFDPTGVADIRFLYAGGLPNPYATVCQTKNLKILLTKIDAWEIYMNDYISDHVYTTVIESGNSYNLNYSTDASGKVISGTSSAGGITGTYVYTYQKK